MFERTVHAQGQGPGAGHRPVHPLPLVRHPHPGPGQGGPPRHGRDYQTSQPLAGQPGQAAGAGLRAGPGAAPGRGRPLPRLLQRRFGGGGQWHGVSAGRKGPKEAQDGPPAGGMGGGRGETRLQPPGLVLGLHDGHRAIRPLREGRELRVQVHRQAGGEGRRAVVLLRGRPGAARRGVRRPGLPRGGGAGRRFHLHAQGVRTGLRPVPVRPGDRKDGFR